MSNPSQEELHKEMLLVLLSIFSGISVILFIILIVVCVRCHPLQSPPSEQVARSASPGLQAHMDYMSVLDSDKARPQLADGYFEVADALPLGLRDDNLPSPAYAEVEQFAPLHKGAWHPYSEPEDVGAPLVKGRPPAPHPSPNPTTSPRGEESSPSNSKENCYNEIGERAPGKEDSSKKSSEGDKRKPKKRVLDRFRGDKGQKSSSGSPDPHQAKRDTRAQNTLDSSTTTTKAVSLDKSENDSDTSVYEDCTSYGYEPIDFPKSKHSTALNGTDKVSSMQSSPHLKHSTAKMAFLDEGGKNDTAGIKPALVITKTDSVTNKPLPRVPQSSPNKNNSKSESPFSGLKRAPVAGDGGHLTVAGKSSLNHLRKTPKRDVPQTKGIVKNGIKLFERQDAVV